MKKYLLLSLFTLVMFSQLAAVFDNYNPSTRARAMSGAYSAISDDAMGIFYNPAGIRFAGNGVNLSYTERFGLDFSVLQSAAVSVELPNKFGVIGFGYISHGVEYKDVDLMSEKQFSLAHSFTLMEDIHSSLHVGYTASLFNLSFGEYFGEEEAEGDVSDNVDFGDQTTFGISLGALAILRERTRLGFSVSNINNPKLGKNNDEDIPRRMAMAITYLPYEGVSTSMELMKNVGEDTQVRAGAEVDIYKQFTMRLGVKNKPSSYSMGFRVKAYDVIIDYAFSTHAVLDMTHQFGIGYRF